MNYAKHYILLIERSKNRILSGYKEKHHIIPKCLGGTNESENLVELTAEEHYLAHLLLVKMYPSNISLVYAANKMTVSSKTQIRNNKCYGWLKRKYSEACKSRTGVKNPSYVKSWFYDPMTLKNGKFLNSDIPNGWI